MKKLFLIALCLMLCLALIACDTSTDTGSSEQTSSGAVEDFFLTIKFHANGGTGTMQDFEIAGGESASLPPCAYINEGYSFEGWATSPTGEVAFLDGIGVLASATESDELNLYAVWAQRKTTISFEGNGASGTMKDLVLDEHQSIALPSVTYTRYGYKFLGWSTDMRGEVEYANGATFTAEEGAKRVTLWAIWEVNGTKVSFDANGGSGQMGTILISALDASPLPENEFTRDGYLFRGWAREANGAIEFADAGSFLAGAGSAEITLYAVWEKLSTVSSITIAIDLSSTMGKKEIDGKTYFEIAQDSISALLSGRTLATGSRLSVVIFDEDSSIALPVTIINSNEAQIAEQICLAMEAYFYEHENEASPSPDNRVSALAGNIDINGYKIKSQGRSFGMAINRGASLLSAQASADSRFILISCGEPSDKDSGYDATIRRMASAGIKASTIMIGEGSEELSKELQALATAGNGAFYHSTTQGALIEALTTLTNNTKGE